MKKERQIVSLPCSIIREGGSDTYKEAMKISGDLVPVLKDLVGGREVLVRGKGDCWSYISEDEGDDHSGFGYKIEGKVVDIDEQGIKLDVTSGEEVYDGSRRHDLPQGEMYLPFGETDFSLRNHNNTKEIEGITVGGILYRPVSK